MSAIQELWNDAAARRRQAAHAAKVDINNGCREIVEAVDTLLSRAVT